MESLEGVNCPLCPVEIDMLDEVFNIDPLNFKEIVAEDSSVEWSVR